MQQAWSPWGTMSSPAPESVQHPPASLVNNPGYGTGPGHNSSLLALWWGSEQLDRERAAESERANRERAADSERANRELASEAARTRFVQMMMLGNNRMI